MSVVPAARAPFTAGQRRRTLDEYFAAERALDEVMALARAAKGDDAARLLRHETHLVARCSGLWDDYLAGLPARALARCPFTGDVLGRSIDDLGLDGLWWRLEGAARPDDPQPPTMVGLTGAMRLVQPVERAPFLCSPGPAVPFVIPRLLRGTKVVAVLSSLRIGRHLGFAISYFSPDAARVDPPNEWGLAHAPLPGGGWSEALDETAYDYDIAPYVRAGLLRWIAPEDERLTLRDDLEGCPYVGLPGRRGSQSIKNGEVW